jgi:F0F1-type ATP synthase membrane subunit b/b'
MVFMKFTYNDIFFSAIIFILLFITNFNIIEGKKNKKEKKAKKKIKKLEKKAKKGKLSEAQQAKLLQLNDKVDALRKKRDAKKEKKRARKEQKQKENQAKKEAKRKKKEKEKDIDDTRIEMNMRVQDKLNSLRARGQGDFYSQRKEVLDHMTSENYWDLLLGGLDSWEKKYIGVPPVEKQKTPITNFDPSSFFMKLNPSSSGHTDSFFPF